MEVKIQSISDLITNSSTETFTVLNNNAENIVTNIVNSILAVGGSTLTFSDLFIFSTEFDERWEEQYEDYIIQYIVNGKNDHAKSLVKLYKACWEGCNWSEWKEQTRVIFNEMQQIAIEEGAQVYNEYCIDRNYTCECMPALEELNIRIAPDLDSEQVTLAAQALNSLNALFSADFRYG